MAQDADALETYRLQPICLRTASVAELTAVPGFSQRVAAAVLRIIGQQPNVTLNHVADTLCLSLPQRLMLLGCTTLQCSPGHTTAATATVRVGMMLQQPRGVREGMWQGGASQDVERVDVRHGQQRLVVVRSAARGERAADAWLGGAADVRLGAARAIVGNVAPSYGCGLAMGAMANTMGPWTSALDQRGATAILRPSTSSVRDGYLQGLGIDATVSSAVRLLGVVACNTHTVWGGIGEWTHGDVTLGGAMWHWSHEEPISTASSRSLGGRGGLAASVYGQATLGGILRWELSRSPTADVATALQWWQRAGVTRWMAAVRWIGADYRAPLGAALTDASAVANEAGITVGCAARFGGWRVDAVADVRRSLTRTYFVPGIVRGATADVQALWPLRGGHQVGMRLFYEGETDGVRGSDSTRTVTAHRQRLRVRASAALHVSTPLTLTARLDGAGAWWEAVRGRHMGSAIAIGMRYVGSWWRASAQWTSFASDGADATVYIGEVAVPGTIRSVALSGRGQRLMCQLHASVAGGMDVAVAYTQHRRYDVATVGTGWEALAGPTDGRLHVQLSWRLRHQGGARYHHAGDVDDEAASWWE